MDRNKFHFARIGTDNYLFHQVPVQALSREEVLDIIVSLALTAKVSQRELKRIISQYQDGEDNARS